MAKKSLETDETDHDPGRNKRSGRPRRTRKDIAYQYEITLDPKPERRKNKDRRNDKK